MSKISLIKRFERRDSGSKLNAENTMALANRWNELIGHTPELLQGFAVLAMNPADAGYKALEEFDPDMLKRLKIWVQCTRLTAEAIDKRVLELKKIREEFEKEAAEQGVGMEEYLTWFDKETGAFIGKPSVDNGPEAA